jgi:hypothetical protein
VRHAREWPCRLTRYSILSADSDGRRSTHEAAFFNYSLKKPGK